jgi:hypothetical protein
MSPIEQRNELLADLLKGARYGLRFNEAYGRAAQEQQDELWNNTVHYKDAMNAAEKIFEGENAQGITGGYSC